MRSGTNCSTNILYTMLYCCFKCCCCCLCCYWREYYSTSMRCWFGCRYICHNHRAGWKHNENHMSCDAITYEITTLWHDKMLSITTTTTTTTVNNVKRDWKPIWRTDRPAGVLLSDVARIWCHEGHSSYYVYTRRMSTLQNCLLWGAELVVRRTYCILCYTDAQSAAAASVATDASTTLPPWDVDSVVVTSVVTIIVLAENTTKNTSCNAITSEITTTLWHDKMLSITTTTTTTINNVKRDRKRIWRTDRPAGVFVSGVARIWCKEEHKSYCVFTLGECRHCSIVYYEEQN